MREEIIFFLQNHILMCYFVFAAQGLIQLCVIVEKDGLGYGLTVSGDKPVHVQSVIESKW